MKQRTYTAERRCTVPSGNRTNLQYYGAAGMVVPQDLIRRISSTTVRHTRLSCFCAEQTRWMVWAQCSIYILSCPNPIAWYKLPTADEKCLLTAFSVVYIILSIETSSFFQVNDLHLYWARLLEVLTQSVLKLLGKCRLNNSPVTMFNPYPTVFPYGNGMVLHFYQQQESSTTKTVHKVINKGLKAYV